jgi:predicted flap endonuclease-1-like 5' DNA nuclease
VAWSFGHSLILLLALLVGLAAGWLLRGRLPGGATGPQSVTRSDIPRQAGSLAPVPVGDTPVTEPDDAPAGTAVKEPADDNAGVEEPADAPTGAVIDEPRDAAVEEPVDDPAGRPQTSGGSTVVESELDTVTGPESSDTAEPVRPVEPVEPVRPVAPVQPAAPIVPAQSERVDPVEPMTPMESMEPAIGSAPTSTVGQSTETTPVEATSSETTTPVPATPVEETADQAGPAEVAPQPDDAEPATVPVQSASAAVTDDNLRRIDGIGPKMALALNAAGFRTYRQLAEATEPELRAAVRAANLRSAPGLSNWAQQARVLAEGGSTVAAGSVAPTGGEQPTRS